MSLIASCRHDFRATFTESAPHKVTGVLLDQPLRRPMNATALARPAELRAPRPADHLWPVQRPPLGMPAVTGPRSPRSESAMPDVTVPGERALRAEAARVGATVQEYLGRLGQGLLYCYRCAEWHDAGAFGRDRRRPSGRAGSCLRSVREARQAPIRRALPRAA